MWRKKYKGRPVVWCAALLALTAPLTDQKAQAADLDALLSRGEVVLMEAPDKTGRQFITGIVLINAPCERVWDVITDFDSYDDFMPQANGIKTIKKDGGTVDVEFNLKFRFSVISTKVRYIMRHTLEKPSKVTARELSGDLKDVEASWTLTPIHDGRATMASYRQYSDLSSLGVLMKYFLKEQPHLGTAVHVSTSALVVRAVKARAEALSQAGNEVQRPTSPTR